MSAITQFFGAGAGGSKGIPVRGLVVTGGWGGSCMGAVVCPSGTNTVSMVAGQGGFVSYYEENITPGVTIPITVGSGGVIRSTSHCLTAPYAPAGRCLRLGSGGGSSCFGSCAYICVSTLQCCTLPTPCPACIPGCGVLLCKLYWDIKHDSSLDRIYDPQYYNTKVTQPQILYCCKAGSVSLRLLERVSSTCKKYDISYIYRPVIESRPPRPTLTHANVFCCSTANQQIEFGSGASMKGFSDQLAANPINHLYSPPGCSGNNNRSLYGPNTQNDTYGICIPLTLTSCICPSINDQSRSDQGFQSRITGSIGLYGMSGIGIYSPCGTSALGYGCPCLCPFPYGILCKCGQQGSPMYPVWTTTANPRHTCIGYGSGGPALPAPEGGGNAGGGAVIVQYPSAYAAATTSSSCVLNCSPNTPGCYTYKFICPGSITFP